MKFAMFMINKYIYNQPSEDFARGDLEMIVALVCDQGMKHA